MSENIRNNRSDPRTRDGGWSTGWKIRISNSDRGMMSLSFSIVQTDPADLTAYPGHFRKTCLMQK